MNSPPTAAPGNPAERDPCSRQRLRNIVVFSAGQGVSSVGSWMQKTAIGWLSWELTHSVAWVGAMALTDLLSAVWVAPLAGAVTDRYNPYRLTWIVQIAMLLLAATLAVLGAGGWLTIELLFACALIESTLQGFNQPLRTTVTAVLAGAAGLYAVLLLCFAPTARRVYAPAAGVRS